MNKTENIMNYAITMVPYYCQFRKATFEEFPIISKKDIKKDYELFLSKEIQNRNYILSCLEKDFEVNNYVIEKKIDNNIYMEWTTGSSGIPFKCIKSGSERKQIALNMWKQRMQIDKKIRIDSFYSMIHTGEEALKFDIRDYSKENLTNLYLDIKNKNTTCIHTTPNLIKRHIEYGDLPLDFFNNIVPYIEMTGNYLSREDKKKIEKIFGAHILNLYGLIEVWGMAYDPDGNGEFSILEKNVKIELVDKNLRIIEQNDVEGEIIVTSLNQFYMPFIRYRTGDIGKYVETVDGRKLVLCKDRDINRLTVRGKQISGSQFAKTILRKIYWKKEFQDIKYVCIVLNNKTFSFVLNHISDELEFEKISKNVLQDAVGEGYKVRFDYINEKEYERINAKNYIFIQKS